MRMIILAVLLGLCGAAMADSRVATVCADAVSGRSEQRAFAAALGEKLADPEAPNRLEIAAWHECQRRIAAAAELARKRAELQAEELRLARLLGRQLPGSGYHIVHFADGRTVGSARVTVYRDGRSIAVSR